MYRIDLCKIFRLFPFRRPTRLFGTETQGDSVEYKIRSMMQRNFHAEAVPVNTDLEFSRIFSLIVTYSKNCTSYNFHPTVAFEAQSVPYKVIEKIYSLYYIFHNKIKPKVKRIIMKNVYMKKYFFWKNLVLCFQILRINRISQFWNSDLSAFSAFNRYKFDLYSKMVWKNEWNILFICSHVCSDSTESPRDPVELVFEI